MSRSWGHGIRSASDSERHTSSKWGRVPNVSVQMEDGRVVGKRACSVRCQNPVIYVTSYRYVTGRAGRVSAAERAVCAEHGARFAQKHGLELPSTEPGPEPPPRFLDEVLRGVRDGIEAMRAGTQPAGVQVRETRR